MSLSYQGEADEWKFSANIDLFAGIRTGRDTDTESPSGRQECTYDEESIYSAKEGYSRFNASHTLWKGNVLFGLSFDNYIQDTRRKDYSVKEGPVHNNSYNIIPGGYVSLEQDFGFLELDAGIHYQYFYSRYSPYEDDRTLERIRELMESDFISFRDQLLHPHLTISAPIGIWTTDLTATIHKQWLHMELADPQDNLTAPLATVNWINSLSLPWGMRVDLSTLLRTKGAESNIYYRNILCKMDVFVQQPFLDNRLIVSLGVDNLLRTHQKAAYYTRMADMELDWNNRLEKRMFKLSVVISL